jgi:hypothetical protein
MTDNIVGTLEKLKTGIVELLEQIEALKNIQFITLNQLPVYSKSITALQESITILHNILVHDVPEEHKLRLVLIETLQLEVTDLNTIINECKKWNDKIISNACCYIYSAKTMILEPPKSIQEKLINGFSRIRPIIEDMIKLEHDILGSAIKIKHPILRRAWIQVGSDQLNSGFVDANQLCGILYDMLEKEENGVIKRKDYCKKMVKNFVRYIDTLGGNEPDSRITIQELDKIKSTIENSATVKGLLGIFKQPNEEVTKQITILFNGPFKVTNIDPVLEKSHRGYGCDWPSKVACEFIVPNVLENDFKEDSFGDVSLFGVNVNCNAGDQNFGGTGHTQVRFQVNDEPAIPAFSVWRDKVPDGNYSFTIGPDKVKVGDNIKIWACSPPWSAWSVTLNSINANVVFA